MNVLDDADATRELGAALAELVEPGDLVVLAGPLGAGKTTLAQGFGAALGVPGPIRSPTYTLVDVHLGGRLPLLHLDAWRLGDAAEVEGLGLDEAPVDAVILAEWGEAIAPLLAPAGGWLVVRLDRPGDAEHRTVALEAHGPAWSQRVSRLTRP